MIYVIGQKDLIGQKNLSESDIWKEGTVEDCLDYFKGHVSIAIDTETQGKDPHSKKILLLQIGDAVNQWVIDVRNTNIRLFKELLESKLCLIHNVSFDYKFLKKAGIVLTKVWDTCITEAILYRGYKNWGYSLEVVCKRYCNVTLNKDVREEFHTIESEPFTDSQIEYASLDVKHLHEIANSQWRKAKELDVLNSVLEDNRALLAYSDMEYYGNKIDAVKWLENALKNESTLRAITVNLNNIVLDTPELIEFTRKEVPSLFDPDPVLESAVNWNSDTQVKKIFNKLGVADGELTSVSEKVIKYHIKDHFIVPLYIEYSKQAKLVSTYGRTFLENCLNKTTGRIHTSYWIVLNTGRASSGGGTFNKDLPNLQNIPNTETYRRMFIAEKDHVLITCDYSQLEPRILADVCEDENMIKLFTEGDGDTHTLTANALYSVIENREVKIDKKDPRRQVGKILNLKLNYGGSAYTVKDDLGKTEEETQVFINALQKAFPKKAQWQKKSREFALKHGYVILEDVNNSKSYFNDFDLYKTLEKEINTKGFWNDYSQQKREMGESFKESALRQRVSKYFEIKGSIERSAMNFPIQGRAAGIVKRAMILLRDSLIKEGLYDKVKLINQIHDELLVESPENIAEYVASLVKHCMIKAGKAFCKKVPMVIEPNIKPYWAK